MKLKYLIISLLSFYSGAINAQWVYSHVGKQYLGSGQFTGTSNNAIADEYFSVPEGVCFDNNARLWITDQHNITVIDGSRSLLRGGFVGDPNEPGSIGIDDGIGIVSRFSSPTGLYAHPSTNDIYICDRDNSLIRKASKYVNVSNGTVVGTYAGNYSFEGDNVDGAIADAYFANPQDIVINSKGYMVVTDFQTDCIRLIKGGYVYTIAGSPKNYGDAIGKGSTARFYAPSGLFLENDSMVLVADRNNRKIKRLNINSGEVTNVITSGLDMPTDMVSINGKLFIADGNCIRIWDGSNLSIYAGSATQAGYQDGTAKSALFNTLGLMTYKPQDECIYVVDQGNNNIRKVSFVDAPVVDFAANHTSCNVNQIIEIKSATSNANKFSYTITPASYSLVTGSSLSNSTIYVKFTSTGTYTVSLTASNAATGVTVTKNNYINVSNVSGFKPVADFAANKVETLKDSFIYLYDLSENVPTSWVWTISPKTYIHQSGFDAGSPVTSLKFLALGKYSISLDATNAQGTSNASKSQYINVVSQLAFDEILRNNQENWILAPNPASNFVQIIGTSVQSVTLFDATGRLISTGDLNNQVLDIQSVTTGTYYLLIKTSDNRSVAKMLMIQK